MSEIFWRRWFIPRPKLSGLKPGQIGEEWIAYVYRLAGFRILVRNYALYRQKKLGEIDLVCQKGRELRVVEVKTRSGESFMDIVEAVGWRKQGYLRRMAKLFLAEHPRFANHLAQIDVAAVLLDPVDNQIKSVRILENVVEDS